MLGFRFLASALLPVILTCLHMGVKALTTTLGHTCLKKTVRPRVAGQTAAERRREKEARIHGTPLCSEVQVSSGSRLSSSPSTFSSQRLPRFVCTCKIWGTTLEEAAGSCKPAIPRAARGGRLGLHRVSGRSLFCVVYKSLALRHWFPPKAFGSFANTHSRVF